MSSTSSNPKKRRGKKQQQQLQKLTEISPTAVEQQLERAESLVKQSKVRAEELHKQWRAHMFRLSILVLLIAFHTSRTPMDECMKTLKEFNADKQDDDESRISGLQAAKIVMQDSLCEIMGILMMSCLCRFLLEQPQGDIVSKPPTFSNPFYLTATVLVPLQIASYYNSKTLGCLSATQDEFAAGEKAEEELKPRNFPVTVLFHSIVTAACWFMDWQMQNKDKEVQEVLDLKEKLEKAKEANKTLKDKKKS